MRFSSKVFARSAGVFLRVAFCALVMPCAVQAGFDFDENGNTVQKVQREDGAAWSYSYDAGNEGNGNEGQLPIVLSTN